MTVSVIEGVEPRELDDRDSERVAFVARAADLLGERDLAGAAQQRAGQLVVAGQPALARGVAPIFGGGFPVGRRAQSLKRGLVPQLRALPAQLAQLVHHLARQPGGAGAALALLGGAITCVGVVVASLRDLIALLGGGVAKAREIVTPRGRLRAGRGDASASAAGATPLDAAGITIETRAIVCLTSSWRRHDVGLLPVGRSLIAVGRMLIAVRQLLVKPGRRLIALGVLLVGLRLRLVEVGERLLTLTQRTLRLFALQLCCCG